MKTLVYLKAQSIVWIGFSRRKLVRVQEQQFSALCGSFESCDWLSNKTHTLPLILDGVVEEIDQYPLKHTSKLFQQRSNANALQRKLVNQNPQSIVQTPIAKANIGALLLNQYQLSEAQFAWLKSVEQSQIRFSSLVTASVVMADYINGLNDSGLNDSELSNDGLSNDGLSHDGLSDRALLVTCMDGVLKHLYCSSGYGLLVRLFFQDVAEKAGQEVAQEGAVGAATEVAQKRVPELFRTNPDSFLPELVETIKHLKTLDSVVTPFSVYVVGLSDHQIEQIGQLEAVATVQRLKSSVKLFAATARENQACLECHGISLDLASHFIQSKRFNKNQRIHYSYPAGLSCFDKHLARRSPLLLTGLSLTTFSLFIHTALMERDRYALLQKQMQKKVAITENIEKYQLQLRDIGEIAVPLGRALSHAERVKSVKALNPATLLTIIAGVLAEHTQLKLLDIAWSVVDIKESDYVTHNRAQDRQPAIAINHTQEGGLGHAKSGAQAEVNITSRSLSEIENQLPSIVRVSVSGLASADQTLREQQALVKSMAAGFNDQPETNHVVIAETPLMHAGKINRLQDSNQPLAFRILFDVIVNNASIDTR